MQLFEYKISVYYKLKFLEFGCIFYETAFRNMLAIRVHFYLTETVYWFFEQHEPIRAQVPLTFMSTENRKYFWGFL